MNRSVWIFPLVLATLSPLSVSAELMEGGGLSQAHLAILANGDAERSAKEAEKCDKCHGPGGVSDDAEMPHLVGQRARYIYKQIMDFKHDRREGGRMNKNARKLSDQQIADMAVRFSSLSLPAMGEITVPPAPPLVTTGDAARGVDACDSCHGEDGRGKDADYESPALAGMPLDYFVATLEAFADGSRQNDPDGVMGKIAKALGEDEIEGLARYYLALGQREPLPAE